MSDAKIQTKSIKQLTDTVAIAKLTVSSQLIDITEPSAKNDQIIVVEGIAAFRAQVAGSYLHTSSAHYIETRDTNKPFDISAAQHLLKDTKSSTTFVIRQTLAWLYGVVETVGAEAIAIIYLFNGAANPGLPFSFTSELMTEDVRDTHGKQKLIYPSHQQASEVNLLYYQNYECLHSLPH